MDDRRKNVGKVYSYSGMINNFDKAPIKIKVQSKYHQTTKNQK